MNNSKDRRTPTTLAVGEAIKKHFMAVGISQAEAADRLGVTQAAISARICGLRPFGMGAAQRWADEFGFRKGWLLTGNGAMLEGGDDCSVNQVITDNTGVAIQQAGSGNTLHADSPAATSQSEGFFTRLCADLMKQIIERDERINYLENKLKEAEYHIASKDTNDDCSH